MTATGVNAMPFTIAQFVLMAIFALLVIGGMIYGRSLKRRRVKAEEEIEEHREAVAERGDATVSEAQRSNPELAASEAQAPGGADAVPEATAVVEAPAPAPPPVAPAPPPIGDMPVPGTPAPIPSADQPATAPLAPAPEPASDITRMKGLGPKLAAALAVLGITRVEQIAAMSPAELDALDARLGQFKGRPARDRWAEQARLLTSGDKAAYEAAFGKLG